MIPRKSLVYSCDNLDQPKYTMWLKVCGHSRGLSLSCVSMTTPCTQSRLHQELVGSCVCSVYVSTYFWPHRALCILTKSFLMLKYKGHDESFKVHSRGQTFNCTSAWDGSGSGMLGPMTVVLSSLSFLSSRPAAITAACCSATRAASSSCRIHITHTQTGSWAWRIAPDSVRWIHTDTNSNTILACLWALTSFLLCPTGGAEYTVGAAWMIDGVGLMGGRGPCLVVGADTMETISLTWARHTNTHTNK